MDNSRFKLIMLIESTEWGEALLVILGRQGRGEILPAAQGLLTLPSSPAIREGEYRKEFSLDNENTRTSISRVKQATSKVKCLPTQ